MRGPGCKTVLILVAGLLVGFLMGLALPVGAHHKRSIFQLKNRIGQLEARINSLEDRTSQLSFSGEYEGAISPSQIVGAIDASKIDTPLFCAGDPAVWKVFGDGLDC